MYVHRKCKSDVLDVDWNVVEYGYCDGCGRQGSIFWVKGTDRDFVRKKRGVTERVIREGGELVVLSDHPRKEPKFDADSGINLTYGQDRVVDLRKVWDKVQAGEEVPAEDIAMLKEIATGEEAESIPEEDKYIEDAIDKELAEMAGTTEIDTITIEGTDYKVVKEEGVESIDVAVSDVETVSFREAEIVTTREPEAVNETFPEDAKKAEIERLKAKLAELEKE
jgi:hypothetical protein